MSFGASRQSRIEHELRKPETIAKVDEDQAAVVSSLGDPPTERDLLADLLGP